MSVSRIWLAAVAFIAPAVVAVPPSATAATGSLSITPASGSVNATNNIAFTAPAACDATAHNFVITATGAGAGAGSNLVGFTAIPHEGSPITAFPLGNTLSNNLGPQGAVFPLNGPLTATLVCLDDTQAATDQFTATINLTPTTGTDSTFTVQNPGPAPTPQPPPIECPNGADCFGLPVPSPSPVPTVVATGNERFRLTIPPDPGPCSGCGSLMLTVPTAPDTELTFYGWRAAPGPARLFGASMWPVTVTDTRAGRPAWTLSAQVSGSFGSVVMRPKIVQPGAGAVAGSGRSPVLASAVAGHGGDASLSGQVGGDLFTLMPAGAAPGSYTATMTLTLLA